MVVRRNYGTGTVVVTPIKTDGSLGDAADVQSIPTSPLGPHQAQDGPLHAQLVPKRFADSGHDAPHAHTAQTDPAGNYLLLSDLGTDRIYIYKLDKTTGKLTPAAQP